MYEVKDGSRILQFNGKILAESSSWRRHSERWIEFCLYRTDNGSYVLSRIGVSLVFHGAACPLVKQHNLTEDNPKNLEDDAVPCDECNPIKNLPVVFPEKYRYWAQVSEDPKAVIDALYKYGKNGEKYLTLVAQRLLEEAAENDEKIDNLYYKVEIIP